MRLETIDKPLVLNNIGKSELHCKMQEILQRVIALLLQNYQCSRPLFRLLLSLQLF